MTRSTLTPPITLPLARNRPVRWVRRPPSKAWRRLLGVSNRVPDAVLWGLWAVAAVNLDIALLVTLPARLTHAVG